MRVTGKLLRETESGKEFGCRECLNTSHADNCVVLEAVDTEYHQRHQDVQDRVNGGELEVVRELHNNEYPRTPRVIVSEDVRGQ